jgi:hypothetical protein
MKRFFGAVLATVVVFGSGSLVRAADQDVNAILAKGAKALGGEDKLGKIDAYTYKAKGTITFGDNDNDVATEATVQGLTRHRRTFEGTFNGNEVKGVTVLNGDQAWRKFGDNAMEVDAAGVINEKATAYREVIPTTLVALKGKDFKVETAGEEKVGDKPAVVLKVTASDGKDFKLLFDKESGLPVKLVARVAGFQGDEFTQETTFDGYKDFGGIKKATKVTSTRDGQKFVNLELTEFKVLDKVEPDTFAEPK